MKIGVLIPTRDRPEFLEQAKRLLKAQTRQPNELLIVDTQSHFKGKDLNWRYRIGTEYLFNKGMDCIVLWEDDDWYCPKYIELMTEAWSLHRSDLFGLSNTIYYHLKSSRYQIISHPGRSSAMSMVIGRGLMDYDPPKDNDINYDIYYSKIISDSIFISTEKVLNLGIKHGQGTCGGQGHSVNLSGYSKDISLNNYNSEAFSDDDGFLESVTGKDYDFYKGIKERL